MVISVFSADAAKYQVSINEECKSVAKLQSRLVNCEHYLNNVLVVEFF